MNINGYNLVFDDKVLNLMNNYNNDLYAPKKEELFKALEYSSFLDTKVVWLGQDPYPTKGDAMGLSFSVHKNNKLPRSLANMFKELKSDLDIEKNNGDLSSWANQGILFLNTILSVEISNANSHKKLGWQITTDKIISDLSNRGKVVFVLLGNQAIEYEKLIALNKNVVLKYSHPSPLSARHSFFGSKIYSEINNSLSKLGHKEIDFTK